MRVSVVVTQVEVDLLLRSLAPLAVDLSSPEEGTRVIRVHEVRLVTLVPGKGARIQGVASVEWPVLGITIPVKIDDLCLDIRIGLRGSDDATTLRLHFAIEDVDLRYLPGFVEAPIVAAVNAALEADAAAIAVKLGELLRLEFPLPSMLKPAREYAMRLHAPHLEVSAETISFAATIESTIAPVETPDQPPAKETTV